MLVKIANKCIGPSGNQFSVYTFSRLLQYMMHHRYKITSYKEELLRRGSLNRVEIYFKIIRYQIVFINIFINITLYSSVESTILNKLRINNSILWCLCMQMSDKTVKSIDL